MSFLFCHEYSAYQGYLATYDYEQKYPEDERYHELDENARVWHVYNDEAEAFDADIVSEAGHSLDVLLIFVRVDCAPLDNLLLILTTRRLSSPPF